MDCKSGNMSSQPSSTFAANDGAGYEIQMGRWSRLLAGPFLDFAGVRDREDVLEVGCGTGSLTFVLGTRALTSRITAIDYSSAYVEFAARRNDSERITFRQGDACELPFADKSFDQILCQLVLHFVPRTDVAVAEMFRVCRLGATAAAAVWDQRGGFVGSRLFWDIAAVLDPTAAELRARQFIRPCTRPGELAGAWRKAGFAAVEDTQLLVRQQFANFDDYWSQYETHQGPSAVYVDGLAPARRVRLKDEVQQAYLDGEADGPRSYAAIAWAVRGTRPK